MTTDIRTFNARHGLRRPRAAGVLAAAAAIVLATYVAGTLRAPATTTKSATVDRDTTADAAPLPAPETTSGLVPGSIDQLDHAISIWSANVAREPRDFISATTLASLYHERGRLNGDLADQQKALEAAATAERAAPRETSARVIEAAVKFTLHDFEGAYGVAQAVVRDEPGNLGALATMADAELELGRIDQARADYDSLRSEEHTSELQSHV